MTRFMRPLLCLSVIAGMSGCATLFAGGNETVNIDSNPSGAVVTTQQGLTLGTTPFVANLVPRDYILTFTLAGHNPGNYVLAKKVDGIAFLNLLCVLCWGIDFATGAIWGIEDDAIRVTLTPSHEMAENDADLEYLACSNYAALDRTFAANNLGAAELVKARNVVRSATNVSRGECLLKAPI
jgi:hypothetical protein